MFLQNSHDQMIVITLVIWFLPPIIIFGIPSLIIASVKGFKPIRWLLTLGLIGLIVVSCMSSARKDEANKVSGIMAAITIIIIVLYIGIFGYRPT